MSGPETENTSRCFAPSQYHRRLLENTQRELAWRGQEFKRYQSRLRARLTELVGGFPRRKVPLNVQELERSETQDVVRQKIVYTSEECADVPAYLLVPKGRGGPLPAVVCLQGHSPGMHLSVGEARDEVEKELVRGDRDFAARAVKEGFVALAVEQRCLGERAETVQEQRAPHTCFDAVMHSLMLGKTMVAERVWDVMRAIDFLLERPEVDPARICCMGNSGGGTTAFYSACFDARVALTVPSCVFCTYADSIMRIYHCSDNYIPGILRVAEMGELAALVAPRKLIVVAGEEDDIFPAAGVRAAFATAKSIFEAAGCPQNIELVMGPDGHRFYADLTWPVIHRMLGTPGAGGESGWRGQAAVRESKG